jgi:enoyl-CoA hydratase/carnithine racemase
MTSRLPTIAAHEVLVTGKRFGGYEAAAKGIVTEALPETLLLPRAIEMAMGLAGKSGPTMGTIKGRLYAEPIALLRDGQGTAPPG